MKLFIKRNRRVLIFTAVVLFFLLGVGVVQLIVNQYQPYNDTAVVKVDEGQEETNESNDDPQAPAEKLIKPVDDGIEIVKSFMMLA
ncbi:hypothetical protein SD457_18110 [Coprobacillaceae bacterium CR2/5/TPMF4]|nr:hypothetical protein SD457_18110 [Coprobacillaceae bacterium CR2/5/TPMF4]